MAVVLRRLALASVAAAVVAAGAETAVHAEYPERPVTVIVPFSAGGNTDVIARIVADHLSSEMDEAFVVENRGGGGGTVGTSLAAGANPDGYTLLFATSGTHSVNPALRDVNYDPLEDFVPISTAVISSVLIVINPEVPANDLEELIALSSGGDSLNYASGGVGTVAHVAGELYNEMTGSEMVHVPYQGAGEVLNDLVAGRVQVNMNNLPTFMAHISSGAVKPLALAATERTALLPDVPTTVEAGLPDLQLGSWFGLVAPAGTDEETVNRLHAAVATMADSDQVKERLAAVGSEVTVSASPADFAEYMANDRAWWAETLDDPAFR